MKINYIILLSLSIFFSSCQDFLEETPTTQLTSEQIYNSPTTALGALNGCYSILGSYDLYAYRFYYLTETASGLFTSIRTNVSDNALASLNVATNDIHNEKVFIANYATIGIANDILYNLHLPQNHLDSLTKAKVIGEASFIRALCYFNLVRMYGRVSLVTQPVTSNADAQKPRSSIISIYKQIISDLDTSFVKMPEVGSQEPGRPHRWAAKALEAKVYLTMATCDSIKAEDKTGCWDSAYVKAKQVVYVDYQSATPTQLRSAYSLVKQKSTPTPATYFTTFSNLFGTASKNNAESIFEIQMSITQGGLKVTDATYPKGYEWMYSSYNNNQMGKMRPNKEAYDLYQAADPRRAAFFIPSTYYAWAVATGTTVPVKKVNYCYPSTELAATDFPYLNKYIDPNFSTGSSCNFVVYRYADLLLVLAEAANELGKTVEATTYVNWIQLRARDKNGDGLAIGSSEATPAYWSTTLSQDAFRTKIMYERVIELFGEGEDWFTTHRRKDFFTIIVNNHNAKLDGLTTDPAIHNAFPSRFLFYYPVDKIDRNMLFPYPSTEISNNEAIPQTDQNYGY